MSGYYPDVILSGRRINDGMGFWLVENFILKMAKSKTIIGNSKILIMGFSFKEDCPDIRNTRVKDIYSALIDYGTKPTIYDPNVNSNEAKKNYKIEVENILKTGIKYEGIIVAVAHQCFIEMKINDWKNLMKENTLILDIKGIVPRVLNPIRI